MSVVTMALCVKLNWLLVSFLVHIKSSHIIIIIIITITNSSPSSYKFTVTLFVSEAREILSVINNT